MDQLLVFNFKFLHLWVDILFRFYCLCDYCQKFDILREVDIGEKLLDGL